RASSRRRPSSTSPASRLASPSIRSARRASSSCAAPAARSHSPGWRFWSACSSKTLELFARDLVRKPPSTFRDHALSGHRLRRQVGELGLIGRVHLRLQPVLCQRIAEQRAHLLPLVGIVDLIAAEPAADPSLRHPLRIADRDALVLERKI